jgi:hypothetical protein
VCFIIICIFVQGIVAVGIGFYIMHAVQATAVCNSGSAMDCMDCAPWILCRNVISV